MMKKNVNCYNQIRHCKQEMKKVAAKKNLLWGDMKCCCELTIINNASKRCTNDATIFFMKTLNSTPHCIVLGSSFGNDIGRNDPKKSQNDAI